MAAPLVASGSHSSDYFSDDPEFINALNEAILAGELDAPQESEMLDVDIREEIELPPSTQPCLKRRRSLSLEPDLRDIERRTILHTVVANEGNSSYLDNNVYGAAHFGEFGEYMTRKRAKLQVQNAEIEADDTAARNGIFRGVKIYINGWTEPSVQDLRQLIIRHGGVYHAYLDQKALVTHVVTCSLTAAKIREFKHMKVVTPSWLVESAQAGILLPWSNYIFKPEERLEEAQGKKIGQKSLLDEFVSQVTGQPILASSYESEYNVYPSNSSPTVEKSLDEHTDALLDDQSFHISSSRTPLKPSIALPGLRTTDPATIFEAKQIPGYAVHAANPHAERAMADPEWRAAHTSVAPDFIEGYYKNSRLHHLSTWKAELRNLVIAAQERVEDGGVATWEGEIDTAIGKIMHENAGGKGVGDVSMRGAQLVMRSPSKKGKERDYDKEKVIMHCDFDSFFVSAGLIDRPFLRGKPVVVCHSQGATGGAASTSEIASASYEARKFGIKSGMSLQQARKLCPTLATMPYEFQKYKQLSLQFYTILMAHADDLQAVSVDEALIDVTSSIERIQSEIARSREVSSSHTNPAKEFAEALRAQVKNATSCEVSIGIAHNITLARLASRRAKPAGSYHLCLADVPEFLAPLDIDDLHGFGYSARQKSLEKLGTTTLGELAKNSKAILCDVLGRSMGETLFNTLRGVDDRKLESDKPRKSVSCDINYGIRFENNAQAEKFIFQMAEEVARRLDSIDSRGRSLTIKIMKRDADAPLEAPKFMGHGACETFNKQTAIITPSGGVTSDPMIIGEHAWKLLKSFNFDPRELRGIGIQIQKLEKNSAATEVQAQAVLPFKSVAVVQASQRNGTTSSLNARALIEPQILVEPPSQDDVTLNIEPQLDRTLSHPAFDLPSFSQVDMSVFEALPADVRQELEVEYKRRSVTPGPVAGPAFPQGREPVPNFNAGPAKGTDVKRITRQFAPRGRPPLFPPAKGRLFVKQPSRVRFAVRVSDEELRALDIDPGVFALLPNNIQREALATARGARNPGVSINVVRKPLRPPKDRVAAFVYRRPPPLARHAETQVLKRPGEAKGEKLLFTETGDVQQVVEAWVDGFREYPPNQRDVDSFAKFLVRCVDSAQSGDMGVEKAVKVAKWWLILLRRYFGVWEHAANAGEGEQGEDGRITSEMVGKAWWRAFWEVKNKMDIVARKKFGGCLSLR